MVDSVNDEKLLIGQINGFFGVKGCLKVVSYTNPRINILSYQPWYVKAGKDWHILNLVNGKAQSKTIVVQIENIVNREQASVYLGAEIYIKKSQLAVLKKNEYYWQDLIGFKVINQNQVMLGVVSSLVDTGANNVLIINGKKEHWIPYIEPFLISVDTDKQEILVDWDENF